MKRREALLVFGGSLSAAIAGCNDLSPGDDGETADDGTSGNETSDGVSSDDGAASDDEASNDDGPDSVEIDDSSPKSIVKSYYAALDAGNLDAVLETIHSESPVRSGIEQTDRGTLEESASRVTITVDETTVVEQNETEAVVEVTTTTETTDQQQTETGRLALRTENGGWRIWDSAPDETASDGPSVEPADVDVGEDPEQVYRRYFEAQSNGDLAVVLGVCHTEGPTFADFSEWDKAEYEEVAASQTFTVEETTIVEEREDAVIVGGTVTWEPDFAEKPNTLEPRLELRTEDGEWRVWDAPEDYE